MSAVRVSRIVAAGAIAAAVGGLAPSTAAAATPTNLVSNAQFASVHDGMTLAQVQTAIGGKRLHFRNETTSSLPGTWTLVQRDYDRTSSSGSCHQTVRFSFHNARADGSGPGPMVLWTKSREEFGCEGIVK